MLASWTESVPEWVLEAGPTRCRTRPGDRRCIDARRTAGGSSWVEMDVRHVWTLQEGRLRGCWFYAVPPKPSKPWGCRSTTLTPTRPNFRAGVTLARTLRLT